MIVAQLSLRKNIWEIWDDTSARNLDSCFDGNQPKREWLIQIKIFSERLCVQLQHSALSSLCVCASNKAEIRYVKWDGTQMIYWHVYNDDWWVWMLGSCRHRCMHDDAMIDYYCVCRMLIVEKFVRCRHPTPVAQIRIQIKRNEIYLLKILCNMHRPRCYRTHSNCLQINSSKVILIFLLFRCVFRS